MVLKIGFESRTWRCGIESKEANCIFIFFSIWLLFRALLVLEELLHFPRLAQFIVYTLHKGLKSRTCCLWIYNTPDDSITKVNWALRLHRWPVWRTSILTILDRAALLIFRKSVYDHWIFFRHKLQIIYIKEASMVSRTNGWVNICCLLKTFCHHFIASETDSIDPPN